MDIGAGVARERKVLANVSIKRSKHVQGAETRITLQQTVFTLTRRSENVERSVIWQVCVDLLELRSPRPRMVARRAKEEARVRMQPRLVGTAARVATCHHSVPRRRCMRSTTASQVGSQNTVMVESIGSYFDTGSVSEGTLEPRSADDNICSMGASECA